MLYILYNNIWYIILYIIWELYIYYSIKLLFCSHAYLRSPREKINLQKSMPLKRDINNPWSSLNEFLYVPREGENPTHKQGTWNMNRLLQKKVRSMGILCLVIQLLLLCCLSADGGLPTSDVFTLKPSTECVPFTPSLLMWEKGKGRGALHLFWITSAFTISSRLDINNHNSVLALD